MSVEIKVPTIDGLTLNTKGKYVKDDISITIGIPHFKGENSDGARPEIDEFLSGELTEYTNHTATKLMYGFCNNYNIISVTFTEVEEVGDRTFSGAAKLENFNMPKVKKVGPYGFHGTKLKYDNSIFQTVEELIGTNQFYSITGGGPINMPNLKNLANACFASAGITSFRADNVVGMAGNQAFGNCIKLEYVYFDKLETGGTQMFNSCKSLKTAVFNSVTSFRGYCFQGCTALETLIIRTPDIVATIDSNMFHGSGFTGTAYVPDNMVEQYKVATNWSVYANQIKPLSEYVEE